MALMLKPEVGASSAKKQCTHSGICCSKLIFIAAAEIGYKAKRSRDFTYLYDKTGPNDATDGSHDWNKYAEDLSAAGAGYYQEGSNKNGYDWCTIFVDWCFWILCGKNKSKADIVQCVDDPYGAGVGGSKAHYRRAGRLHYSNPLPGDEIFFGDSHTGIVYKVDDKYVYTIEGNTSQGVYARYYPLSRGDLTYGRPIYDVIETNPVIPIIEPGTNGGASFNGTELGNPGSSAYNNSVYGTTNLPFEYLNADNLVQYVATLDRHSPELRYSKFVDNNIAAAIIEAGYLYTSGHWKLDSTEFKSPKFYDQIKACDEADVPIGLWMTCRARSEEEAKLEMNELRKCVQVAKVSVGVWLKLIFTKSVTINDKIVTIYKEQLHKMGLQGKIGFYVTEEQLKTVTWEDHCEDWHLWLVDHVSDVDLIDELLTPQFFKLDNGEDDINETEEDVVVDLDKISTNFGQALTPIVDVSYEFGASLGTEPGRYVSSFTDPGSNYTLPFAVYVPNNAKENMPLHVFLHGDGEVDRLDLLTENYGPMKNTKAIYGEDFPFICIYPCRHSSNVWPHDKVMTTLKGLITAVCDQYQCNPQRIMLSGHSGGASGVWQAVSNYGDFFSCAVPISVPRTGLDMNNMIKVPIWAFCGNKGDVMEGVSEQGYGYGMLNTVNSIVDAGGDAKFTWLDKYHYQTKEDAFTQDTFNWMLAK